MIASLGLILLCQLLGEVVVHGIGAPIPGPVVGLIVLLLLLQGRDRIGLLRRGPLGDGGVERAASGMLAHLSLLFVPAGVGVVQHLDLVSSHGIGTARAFQVDTVAGVAMGLNALVTLLIVPVAVTLLMR